MELTEQGVLIINEEDICKLYFYLNHKPFYVYDSSINVYREAAWHGRIVK